MEWEAGRLRIGKRKKMSEKGLGARLGQVGRGREKGKEERVENG